MSAERLLELSPLLERGVLWLLVVAIVALAVMRRSAPRLARTAPSERVLVEWALLLLVLVAALITRTLWASDPGQPRWYFPETSVLFANWALREGQLWTQWTGLLRTTRLDWLHQSAVMMPVSVAFQALLGPSFELPTYVGAFWGVLAVLLAWALGRAVHSPLFGLVFAGFVAASPLQITWARLGGVQIGSSAHVLLVLWLSYLAGARRSVLLAAAAGLGTWATFYHYYAARVALPLAALALLAGLRTARPRALRAIAVLGVFGLCLASSYVAVHREQGLGGLWPRYPGYVGNRGEQSSIELVEGVVRNLAREAPRSLRAYFWRDRAPSWRHDANVWRQVDEGDARKAGMQFGGLSLAPVSLLAILGFLSALRNGKRDFLWLALALLGFLLPGLSLNSARRLLMFDLAACAFAARGLLVVLGSRWFAGWSPARVAVVALAVVLSLTVYSASAIWLLGRARPPNHGVPIPFGESGFGDGIACRACLEAGRRWQAEIEQGALVVLFDSDLTRENLTAPGSLPLFGEIAALAAGRPGDFLDYYDAANNFDRHPSVRAGRLYDPARTNSAGYLAGRIVRARRVSILWHFPQPTQWEVWLMERLVAAGGVREPLPHGPLLPVHHIAADSPPGAVIRTPWSRVAAALQVLNELDGSSMPMSPCLRVEPRASQDLGRMPLMLAAAPELRPATPPEWAVGSWHATLWRGRELPSVDAIALAMEAPLGVAERLQLLTRWGLAIAYDATTGARSETSLQLRTPVGRGCAARVGSDWWAVDPISGRLSTSARIAAPLASGRWMGIAGLGSGRLLLASADQSLHVIRAADQRELLRFPALVAPSRGIHFRECTPLVAGEGWIASFDALRSLLSVHDYGGRFLGVVQIGPLLQLGRHFINAVGAAGRYLGTGHPGRVSSLEISIAPECTVAGPGR